jgi:4-cresol dehydrogenase (hydroxylating)
MATQQSAPVRLPPGVSEDEFAAAVEHFASEIGADKVLRAEDELLEFRDPFQYEAWTDYSASAIVMPTTVDEVQAVVRVANERRIPLWTHSRGMNNGYGGPAPRLDGSVIVSLRNMDKVLEIDEELAYCVVEPGVRWFDPLRRDQGRRPQADGLDPRSRLGRGGQQLPRERRDYLPQAQDMAAYCGMEVVLANGELLRTGMGAMPDNRSWHVYKRSLGPTLDQLFMQSNFGIVTKLGVWLMPWPECYMPLCSEPGRTTTSARSSTRSAG